MRFLRMKTLLLCLVALFVGAGSASAAPKGGAPADPHSILVKFDRSAHSVVVKLKPGESVGQALATYQSNPNVAYAEANVIEQAQTLSAPNDPSYSSQWSLATTHALAGWDTYPGSYAAPATPQPPIAIVDSGVDSTHPDLAHVDTADGANCLSGTCASSTALDDYGHGTHVAGIAAASANNLTGIAGVAYDAPLIPVKVLDSTGSGSAAGVAAGITWAADHGARVINLSLGSTSYSQTVCDAVTYALSKNALVVAAAGNNGSTTPFYPAACPGAVGVGATDSTDAVPYWSNTGSANVFVTAPGVNILSTYMGGGYATESGTSMAAPFVSGLAELLMAQSSSRTPGDVERILASTSTKAGSLAYGSDPKGTCTGCSWNASYGYGRVNVYNALTGTTSTGPDFAVVASPASLSVTQGGSATSTISLSNLNGFKGTVTLSTSGAPTGTTAKLSRTSLSGTTTATLTVATTTSTPAGSYTVTVKGVSGSLTHTSTVTLTVAAPVPDFKLSASPTAYSVRHGSATTKAYKITIAPSGGFKGTVSLAADGLPPNLPGKWSATSVSITSTSSVTATYTVSIPATAAAGSWPITVTVTSGSITHTLALTLTVT